MGVLQTFDLKDYIEKYNLGMYYESGISGGSGFRYAMQFNFKKLFGSEIVEGRIDHLIEEFKQNENIELYCGKSVDHLKKVLNENPNENFLFWLDGHYPGEKFDGASIEELLPLKKELEIIFNHAGNHVILIDDLRIYEDAAYEAGQLPDWALGDKTGIQVSEKYNQEKLLKNEGYLILTPKEIKSPIEEKPVQKLEKKIKKSTTKK